MRFAFFTCVMFWAAAADGAEDRPLRVLFLGDRGHHQPADRAAQIIPILADRGIQVAYTERMENLNPETLGQHDALLLYANIDEIAPGPAKALLDYVAGGGGFVPVHCASYCFRNNPEIVALIGGQFLKHGAGEVETRIVAPDHPIMRGFQPFATWDETYEHQLHNERERVVLQVRGETNEPWTWVRTHGEGRVFYTAYGHDFRAWENPGFHALLERGIRWAANQGEVFDSNPRVPDGPGPFEFAEVEGGLPSYKQGGKWGETGAPISKVQKPLSADQSRERLFLPRGFEAKLFVSEPEIGKPLAIAWDHRGRLWICETVDYPNDLRPPGKGNDHIKICEDTDGDGRADKFTVFAEGLSIPTGLAFANGGVVVLQAPDTLFLKDTDGDDRADTREQLFTGWGTRDTHAGPSNLRYGLDNWLYCVVGYSGFTGEVGGERHRFGMGIVRFRPDGSKLEFLRSTNNNTWGLGLSEEGLVFASTANGCPSVHLAIPNRYYERVRGWSPSVLANIAPDHRYFPITEKVRQVDFFGGFTAGAGHALYTARNYPPHYWNRTAFIAEPTGHLLATFALVPRGSDFVAYNSWNLVASDDEWSAPIAAEVGPDGNVWLVDWYNIVVQHNPTPAGFETGERGAYVTPLRDKTHGRIYRIVRTNGKSKPAPVGLDSQDPAGLVAALRSDNMLWRLHAQRLLIERGQHDVLPALIELTKNQDVDSVGLNPGAIHALATLHGLGALDGKHDDATRACVAALSHTASGVRRVACEFLPKSDARAIIATGLLSDPEPRVRLAALLALADAPASPELGEPILAALSDPANLADRWIPEAATSAAAAHDAAFLKAVATRKFDAPPNERSREVLSRVAEHYARGVPKNSIRGMLGELAQAQPEAAASVIGGLARGWPKHQSPTIDAELESALIALFEHVPSASKGDVISLGERWGSARLEKQAAEIARSLSARAADEKLPDDARLAAAVELIGFRPRDGNSAGELLQLIGPRTSPELSAGLLRAIGQSEAPSAGAELAARVSSFTPALRKVAITTLLARADWSAELLSGIEEGEIALSDLSLDQKQALAAHPEDKLAERAKKLLERGDGLPDADRQKVIEQLAPQALAMGDAARGKTVFKEQCAKCHLHSGEGTKIGPDLTGMAAHPKEELLIHILDPSRSVEGNFRAYTVVTDDGRVVTGLLASESKTALELFDSEGKRHAVLRENIEQLEASPKSLMPEGFEKQVPVQALADLLEFLASRGKYLPLDLRKVATVVSSEDMFFERGGSVERLIFPDWSPKEFAGVPFHLVDPDDGRTPNAVLLNGPLGVTPPKMPKSVSLPVNAPAKAIHFLSGVSGWGHYSGEPSRGVAMIVRIHYADGATEDHELLDGIHFADYITHGADVPESKLAFKLRDQQIRYLAVVPRRAERIESIELVKGDHHSAPVVMAITVEGPN